MPPPPAVIAAPAEAPPVRAIVETHADRIHVRLIGLSPQPVEVRYALTLVAGTNRSTQGGNAQLAANFPVTLLDLTQSTSGQWNGVLDLTVANGRSYRIVLGPDVPSPPLPWR